MEKQEKRAAGARKRRRGGLFLMLLGAALVAAGLWGMRGIPDRLQAALPAPASGPDKPISVQLSDLRERLEGFRWAAALRQQGVRVASDRAGADRATVYAVEESYFDFAHETLVSGRLISAEDKASCLPSAVINRAAADQLYPGVEPLGQTLTLGDTALEVVGVTEGGFRPGETDALLVFVPISLADTGKIAPETLEIHALGGSAEETAAFEKTVTAWSASATVVSARRLRARILLPLWAVALALGIRLLSRLIRRGVRRTRGWIADLRQELQIRYWTRLSGKTRLRLAAVPLMASLGLAAAWGLLRLAAAPLYVFTDWVPEALASPAAIAATAEALLQKAAVSSVYRTRLTTLADLCAAWTLRGTLLGVLGALLRATGVRKEE